MGTPIHWLSTQKTQIANIDSMLGTATERYGYTIEDGTLIDHPIGMAQARAVEILETAKAAMIESCDILEAELAVIDTKEVK